MRQILSNAKIVTPENHFEGSLVIDKGTIVDIVKDKTFNEGIDLSGQWLVPGCIDIHSDYIEKEINPRKDTEFPIPMGFHFMDQRAAACGITTLFSAIGFMEYKNLRTFQDAIDRATALENLAKNALVRHYIHARLDPNSEKVLEYLDQMKTLDLLKLVVVNDNIPGQRQYSLEQYIKLQSQHYGITKEACEKQVLADIAERSKINKRPEIMEAFKGSIPLGSHDDTKVEHIHEAKQFGATLSEMPTTIEAAREAKKNNMWVCMGAPNYYRGGSHCGNLSCKDAMKENLVDIICSDYHFPTMLSTVIKMIKDGYTPSKAVNLVSLNPARFLGMDDTIGSLEIGKKADIVAFDDKQGFAKISNVWVNGTLKLYNEQKIEQKIMA